MTDAAVVTGLRRIARPAPLAEPPTPARALRQAFARAADRGAGLPVVVLGVTEDRGPLDGLLARLEPGLLLLAVEREGAAGLVALDGEARSAVVEALTLGRPSAQPADPRPPTAVDAALATPLARLFLSEAEEGCAGTALAGWIGPARVGDRIDSAREAALALPDGDYRAIRLTLDLGAGGRQGLALLLLPVAARAAAGPGPDWASGLSRQVLGAEVTVTAVLHRLSLPFVVAEGLEPGTVLPLAGVTVSSVRLEGPGRTDLGAARLGQVAGQRAVRVERPAAPILGPAGPHALGPAEASAEIAEPGPALAPGAAWPEPGPAVLGWPETGP